MSINLIFSNSFLNFGVSGTKVSYQEMCSGENSEKFTFSGYTISLPQR